MRSSERFKASTASKGLNTQVCHKQLPLNTGVKITTTVAATVAAVLFLRGNLKWLVKRNKQTASVSAARCKGNREIQKGNL